jgi:hypothetical protein
LLSPWVEKRALEAATGVNYRPAAAELWRWLRVKVSAWLIWKCVQFHGSKLCEQLDRGWWPDRAQARRSEVVVTEIDSTYLKAQQRGRNKAAHFPIHLGLHYSGRERRYQKRGSTSVRLANKRWILSTEALSIFARRLAWQRLRHFQQGACEVLLSDGDEGLKWVREREFAQSHWLLDAGTSRRMCAPFALMMSGNIAASWPQCGRATAKQCWKHCELAHIAARVAWNLTLYLATSWATAMGSTTGI